MRNTAGAAYWRDLAREILARAAAAPERAERRRLLLHAAECLDRAQQIEARDGAHAPKPQRSAPG